MFFDLVQKRESCRSFSDKPVTKEQLTKCIEAARLSPSACDSQPWSFVVINNKEKCFEVAHTLQKLGMNKFTDKAAAFIIVCEEAANLTAKLGNKIGDQQFSQIDIGLATAHICYAATDIGLSTCILGWFDEKKLASCAGLPKGKRIRLVIAVGYASSDNLRIKKRKSLDEIMTYID